MFCRHWCRILLALTAMVVGVVGLLAGTIPVTSSDETYAFLLKFGTYGTGNGQFSSPRGVALDASGNVYVADGSNDRIQKFTSSGTFLAVWGTQGYGIHADGKLSNPRGVALDASGNMYVVDSGTSIQKFNSSGAFLAKWGTYGAGDGQFMGPNGIAVDASGNVYVADWSNRRIQKFDSSGTFLAKWGTPGSGDGQFEYPMDVAVDSLGNVYVTDYGNDRIQKFTSSGAFLTKWGTNGTGDGQFDRPYYIAVDALGNVYVTDYGNDRIQKFTSSGAFLTKWGTNGTGDGQFDGPYGVAVDALGNVYVADEGNRRIQKFEPPPPDCMVNNQQVTNITDVAFTVTWRTAGLCTGQVRYGTSAAPLTNVAQDDKGPTFTGELHHVTVAGLLPNETWQFHIVSGGVNVMDTGGQPFSVQTGPTLGGPETRLVYGKAYRENGITAATGAIAHVRVTDGDGQGSPGESQVLSSLVEASAYWNTNLGTLRVQALSSYFTITDGDQLCVEVQGGSMGRASACVPVTQAAPAQDMVLSHLITRTIDLVAGLNFIALPVQHEIAFTASTLAADIVSKGGQVAQIDMWNESTGMWKSYIPGLPFNDFSIAIGRAYFLKMTGAVAWQVTGTPITTGVALNLVSGLNGVGIPYSTTPLTAALLLAGIQAQGGNVTQLDTWDESMGMWKSYKLGTGTSDFDIVNWRGYFLKSTATSTYTP